MKGRNVISKEALKSWNALNDVLRNCLEREASQLLQLEERGKRRRQFLLRIQSRINRLRRAREREKLMGLSS